MFARMHVSVLAKIGTQHANLADSKWQHADWVSEKGRKELPELFVHCIHGLGHGAMASAVLLSMDESRLPIGRAGLQVIRGRCLFRSKSGQAPPLGSVV